MITLLAQVKPLDQNLWWSFTSGFFSYMFSVAGFLLAIVLIARLMREKRQPGNTLSWLMVLVFFPHLGVPLYLLVGGRKLRRLAARKDPLYPRPDPHHLIEFEGWDESHPLFNAASGPPTSGNDVHLLLSGEETYRVLIDEINNARHTIHIMIFLLGRDDVGREIVNLLAKRAAEGVKVRLMVDALGSFRTRGCFVNALRKAGGETARFMPMLPIQSRWSANLRNHRKMAIFDGQTAIVGGHNLASEYIGPEPSSARFQDFGARISGPAVRELSEIFIADWNFATGKERQPLEPPPVSTTSGSGNGIVQVIAGGPDVAEDPLYEAILLLIQEAEEEVVIITPYFIPDEVLFRILMLKLNAGRNVTIIVPKRSNHPLTDLARAHYLRELQRAGAKVLTYLPGMLHAKVIIIDRKVMMFGSVNIDLRSLFVNYEIGLFCYSSGEANKASQWAAGIESLSSVFEKERVRPPGFLRALAEDLSRLLAPLM